MIVTCERCETEFQLDDARVPEGGARVRCSRCKHAFFVMPPAASPAQQADQAASAALADDPTPGVTEDLVDDSIAAHAEDDESDWEFNRDLPADHTDSPDARSARSPGPGAARGDRVPADPPGQSFDLGDEPEAEPTRSAEPVRPDTSASEGADLGSPVEWNFFDDDDERPAPFAPAPPPRARAAEIAPTFEGGGAPESSARRELPAAFRIAAASAGWIATAGLCALALVRGLASAPPAATAWPQPAPGIALEEVRGRWLDNVSLGRLYVVSGRVHNTAATFSPLPPLVLELRDPAGRAVGSAIRLRGASSSAQLRQADAAALTTAGADAPGAIAPGLAWEFEAVAWPLPARAARFAIRAGS